MGGRTSIGFKAHIGWASAVVIEDLDREIGILAKERIPMRDTFEAAAVYHVGHERKLSLEAAQELIDEALRESIARAKPAIAALAKRVPVERAAILSGSARPLPPLESILRSHPLVHTAEGELYRQAVTCACEALGIPVVRVPAKGLDASAATLGTGPGDLRARLAAAGKASGKPWAAEQRECALAAWVALRKRG
jgi:hypothetical protein